MNQHLLNVDETTLIDLENRLENIRWTDHIVDHPDWSWGTAASPLMDLIKFWRDEYDWRATEKRLNRYPQGLQAIGDLNVHYFRVGNQDGTPLFLLHGWPDSILRFEKAIPLLQNDFDLIIPSIPGYGFSSRPSQPGFGPNKIADILLALAAKLDIGRFGVHGGDIGSTIAESMALQRPDCVIGLHLLDVPFWHRYNVNPSELTPAESRYSQAMTDWFQAHGAYAALQRTKPQTLAYALNDSPVGLAAWMLEKFQAWSDCSGDVWKRFHPREILDNIMIYWVTQTVGSSVRYYRDASLEARDSKALVTVPTGFSIFPKDIPPAPKEFGKRFFNVTHWRVMPSGGHFGPWEEPSIFADELRTFFDTLK